MTDVATFWEQQETEPDAELRALVDGAMKTISIPSQKRCDADLIMVKLAHVLGVYSIAELRSLNGDQTLEAMSVALDPAPFTFVAGAKAVAPGRAMRLPAATTFAQLRGEVLDGMAADQAAQVRSLPAVATAFRSAQHVSNEQVEARLSDEVGASVALGYKHIVLSHTPRATAPAPAPAGNAHAVLMGAANTPVQLPDLYTCGEDSELTYEYELLL
eukprot:gene1144-4715_t